VSEVGQRNWDHNTPFFHYPPTFEWRFIPTTSAEALHRSLRKIIKTWGAFPNRESPLKLLFLAIRQAFRQVDHAGAQLEPRLELFHRPVA
jgi:putative transposase